MIDHRGNSPVPGRLTRIPKHDGWAVKRERADLFEVRNGDQWAVKKPHDERLYSTQKIAIDAARRIALRSSASQIVATASSGGEKFTGFRRCKRIVFAIHYLGFVARCALEVDDASEARLATITRIIKQ